MDARTYQSSSCSGDTDSEIMNSAAEYAYRDAANIITDQGVSPKNRANSNSAASDGPPMGLKSPYQSELSMSSLTNDISDLSLHAMKQLILPPTHRKSPFHLGLPTNAKPINKLILRLQTWIKILKSLVNYYQVLAVSCQQMSKIHLNLCEAVNFPMFVNGTSTGFNYQDTLPLPESIEELVNNRGRPTQGYPIINEPLDRAALQNFLPFGAGSIQDAPNNLILYHKNISSTNLKLSTELTNYVIPRLEELRKDLNQKIKEIRTLSDDFRNDLKQEIALTGQKLSAYLETLAGTGTGTSAAAAGNGSTTSTGGSDPMKRFKQDPFMAKFRLDYQLKSQILQENYLQEAYINLQSTAASLEKIVFEEIQKSFLTHGNVIDSQTKLSYKLIMKEILQDGLGNKKYYEEWNSFIDRDDGHNFLKDLKVGSELPKARKLSDIEYPFKDNFMSKCIKTGYLNKKSKLLKNYKKGFYLLTVSSLFEFAANSSGFELKNAAPVASYNLNRCTLLPFDHSKNKFEMIYKHPSRNIPADTTGAPQESNLKIIVPESLRSSSDASDQLDAPFARSYTLPSLEKEFGPHDETDKISFKFSDQKELLLWYRYLKQLLKFSSANERAKFIEKRSLKCGNNEATKSPAAAASSSPSSETVIRDGIVMNADGLFGQITENNRSESTITNDAAGWNEQRNEAGVNNLHRESNVGLQGIAPEILISDLTVEESKQLAAHYHSPMLSPKSRPVSFRSNSSSSFNLLNPDQIHAKKRPTSFRSHSNSSFSNLLSTMTGNEEGKKTRSHQRNKSEAISVGSGGSGSSGGESRIAEEFENYKSGGGNKAGSTGKPKRPLMSFSRSTSNLEEIIQKGSSSTLNLLRFKKDHHPGHIRTYSGI
ncbi:Rgc1 protein [Saccharomycopsis crataegensis]|uniref:Rgc1 protein n=1 Tax=Saccharomycopsis crataegensis TaxID=43959 RepID=A0AAV5QWE9_9ASCO|nr:Rgc1 protein [Saccharomycopsis crataegensis]